MPADIQHIKTDLLVAKTLDIENIAADLIAGPEFPGGLGGFYPGRMLRQQAGLNGGCGLEVLIQQKLLVLKILALLLYFGHIVDQYQEHGLTLILDPSGTELQIFLDGFAVDVKNAVQRPPVYRRTFDHGFD